MSVSAIPRVSVAMTWPHSSSGPMSARRSRSRRTDRPDLAVPRWSALRLRSYLLPARRELLIPDQFMLKAGVRTVATAGLRQHENVGRFQAGRLPAHSRALMGIQKEGS